MYVEEDWWKDLGFWIWLLVFINLWGAAIYWGYWYFKKRRSERQPLQSTKPLTDAERSQIMKMFEDVANLLQTLEDVVNIMRGPIFAVVSEYRMLDKADLRYCNPEYVRNLMDKWWTNIHFKIRKTAIFSAYIDYLGKEYSQSVAKLLPELKNIINEWATLSSPDNDKVITTFNTIFNIFSNLPPSIQNMYSNGLLFLLTDTIYFISKKI